MKWSFYILPLLLFSCSSVEQSSMQTELVPPEPAAQIAEHSSSQHSPLPAMPNSEQWLTHVRQDIAPFYLQAAALGEQEGNFPTFRCNNGDLPDLTQPCPELQGGWVVDKLGRQYTRMLSRQIYSYAVIFHLTGDEDALAAAKAGVDYLRANLLDKDSGGALSYLNEQGEAGLRPEQRTSQDLAYAQLGMAFYYYLSRDPEVLAEIIKLKNYIFEHYRDEQNQELKWVLADSEAQKASQRELVAQLDQINAYMLLMIPLLPEAEAEKWKADLAWLIQSLLKHYHDGQQQRFYGYVHHVSGKGSGARHGDRGHTIKAYWMLYLSARLLEDDALMQQAEQGMRAVLKAAYEQAHLFELMSDTRGMDPDMEVGFWNARPHQTGSSWWQWAELDQAAETLAFKDPAMQQYLAFTYASWMTSMVDKQHGGIYSYAFAAQAPKLHHWKNGYHGLEHALVAYLGATQREGKAAELYFALPENSETKLQPYYFSAEKLKTQAQGSVLKVEFQGIH